MANAVLIQEILRTQTSRRALLAFEEVTDSIYHTWSSSSMTGLDLYIRGRHFISRLVIGIELNYARVAHD